MSGLLSGLHSFTTRGGNARIEVIFEIVNNLATSRVDQVEQSPLETCSYNRLRVAYRPMHLFISMYIDPEYMTMSPTMIALSHLCFLKGVDRKDFDSSFFYWMIEPLKSRRNRSECPQSGM